jgi:hypothetical protein
MKDSEIKKVFLKKNPNDKSVNTDNIFTFSNEKEPNYNPILTTQSQNDNKNILNYHDSADSDFLNKNHVPKSNISDFNKKKNNIISYQKHNIHNDLTPNPFGNESYYTNSLKKPLLSSIKNNTKNNHTNDNFIIHTSEIKNDLNVKKINYESNSFLNNLINPKVSNAFFIEYEKSVINCNNICANTCTKNNFIDLINIENEEIFEDTNTNNPRINPNHFISSSKSYLILLITVIISSFHFGLYRKLSSLSQNIYLDQEYEDKKYDDLNYLTSRNIISDINIFTWRFQIISFLLFIYIVITNYLIKNNYSESLEGRFTILEDIRGKEFYNNQNNSEKKLHMIYLDFHEIITLENIKNVGILCSSIFLLFFSSLFIPISMCLAIQYLTILLKFFYNMGLNFEIKSNKLFRLIVYMLTFLGIVMSLSNDFFSTYVAKYKNKSENEIDKIDFPNKNNFEIHINNSSINSLNEKESVVFNESLINKIMNNSILKITENSSSDLKYKSFFMNLLGITFSILSGLINVFFCDNINKHYLSAHSAFEYLIILNFNATIIMTFVNFFLNSYYGNPLYSINWLIQNDNNLNIYIIIFGIIAFLNIMFTIFSSVYLNDTYLKFLKILEIPFADTIAISILSVYKYTNEINYNIGLINIMIAIVLLEFSECFIKRSNSKKYDF